MNMQNLMVQAQKMQRELAKKKEEIDNSTFEGKSEWITIKMNGKKEIEKVTLTYNGTISEDDKDMLEDMIKIAVNKTVETINKEIENKLGAASSGLGGLF